MTANHAGGRWRVRYRTRPPLTVSKWRSDVTLPDPERPFKITVGVTFNALAENGIAEPSLAPAIPQRPAPYPATARPGKFLLDR
jgi:hypothetical protein